MEIQIIKTITDDNYQDKLTELTGKLDIIESWSKVEKQNKRYTLSVLAYAENTQKIIDKIEAICGRMSNTHILVLPVSALKSPSVQKHEKAMPKKPISPIIPLSREELHNRIDIGAELTNVIVLMTIISTIAAAFGLLENNVSVLIGAMVIAPLLGPNLAMAFASTLGDRKLMLKSIYSNFSCILIALVISAIIGIIWPQTTEIVHTLMNVDVNFASLVIALGAGVAAVLSLTTGVSGALVGVMLAVALLPPLVTTGIMLGSRNWSLALGSGMLFATNVVSINFAAGFTFLFQGIRPSRWYEKQKAKKSIWHNLLFWSALLFVLCIIMYLHHGFVFF